MSLFSDLLKHDTVYFPIHELEAQVLNERHARKRAEGKTRAAESESKYLRHRIAALHELRQKDKADARAVIADLRSQLEDANDRYNALKHSTTVSYEGVV